MSFSNYLGIRNALFNILDKKNLGSTEYSIAYYLLKNFNHLGSINIYKMVEECSVSRSTIDRFFKSLGYKNFLEFKKSFQNKYNIHLTKLINRPYKVYIDILTEEILKMMEELKYRMNSKEVLSICNYIHDSEKVVFLSSSSNAGIIRNFQQEFIYLDKIIYSISQSYENDKLMTSLNKTDLLINFSITGDLAKIIENKIKELNCKKILITINRDSKLKDSYDNTYYLSSKDMSELDINIYNRYALTYMLDILLNNYSYMFFNK